MWAVENQTPFATERTFVRDRDGAEIWLVAVRATFDILPNGRLQIAKSQLPVANAPKFVGKPALSSLRWDTDLPRTKLGTDVLLNGSAHVPGGRPQREVEVTLQVANIKKSLLVSGPAHRDASGVATQPEPFQTQPITYERAFGGPITQNTKSGLHAFTSFNPLGMGLDESPGAAIPQVRYPGTRVDDVPTNKRPAGFGAICSSWMPRRQLAGTYDEKWKRERQPLLPEDFNDEFYYAAPEDQRVPGYLRGGEQVELTNLTPSGRLTFRLPQIAFGFRTSMGGGVEQHRGNLHTVLIEPDRNRLVMVWHTSLPCHHTLYTLKRTIVFQKERRGAENEDRSAA
jgi:hypothetical protein